MKKSISFLCVGDGYQSMKRLSPISLLFLVCKLVATTSARLNTVWIGERVAFSRPGGGVVEEKKWGYDEREEKMYE